MDIIEELHKIKAEEEISETKYTSELKYKMSSRAWRIYIYLKSWCVGEKNAKQCSYIVKELRGIDTDLFDEDYSERTLRYDIRKIRTTMPRRIGSSSKGYWLMTSFDDTKGTKLLEKQFISICETLIQVGVNPELLHRVVGALGRHRTKMVDGQGTLPIGEYLREVIHTLSDDLIVK